MAPAARPPAKPRRRRRRQAAHLLLFLLLGLVLVLVLVRGAMGAAAAQEDGYYDDDDYDAAAEYEYDDYPPEAMEEAYYVVDLDPKAPGTTIQRAYMKCFLPFHPEAPAQDGDWRVADPGLQVTLDLRCLLASVPEGKVDGAPRSFQPPPPREPEARLPLLRVGEEYACEQASAASTTCYGRVAPLVLEAAFSRPNGYYHYSARQLDLQEDLLDFCAYYTDARDYDDCLAAFYDWQDLTDQFTRSPDPARKPRRFAERRELREEVIYRLYVETPEFVAGELFARFDEARIADLAVLDREVNGGGDEGAKGPSGGGGGGEQRQGRRQQKVLIDGAGRLVPDVDPESMVLPRSAALARGYGRWGAEEEAGDEEALSPPRMTAAEAAELAGWDEEGSDPADAVFFERSLQPLPPGAHRWWPPPPPPPPGTALPPPLLDGEPAHGPEEAQVLLTKIIKNAFATAPPEGEAAAAPRLEDPFEPRFDDGYWDDGAGGYYDEPPYADGDGGGYDEAMVAGVSPTGQMEPIGEEILDEWYYTDVTKMPDNMTAGM